jgi:hypothetical protein
LGIQAFNFALTAKKRSIQVYDILIDSTIGRKEATEVFYLEVVGWSRLLIVNNGGRRKRG